MRIESTKIIRMEFIQNAKNQVVNKTAIETSHGTVWADGDTTNNRSTMVNIVINEPGDEFIASSDSKNKDDQGKPLFLKGDTVTRLKLTKDFKSFVPSVAEQFVHAAFE